MERFSALFLILLTATAVYSQGPTGANERTKSAVKNSQSAFKTEPKKKNKNPVKSLPSTKTVVTARVSKPPKVITAALNVTVDQSDTGIVVSRIQNGNEIDVSSWTTTESGKAVFFNPLDAGDYIVKTQKKGFYDEQKKITLRAGKSDSLNLILRPSAGVLAVTSDAEDAQIIIETIGNFSGQFKNFVPAPQLYEVSVSADGYEPLTQKIKVELGQMTTVNANLKLITSAKLLQTAQNNYQSGNYKQTLADCRLILARNPDDAQANLLMGYAYFYTQRPRESRFYLVRAVSLQSEIEIPVKIYQKEKNSETLTDGIIKINRNNLSFYSAKLNELNLTVSPSVINKLEINREKGKLGNAAPKPDSIEIKATITNGKRNEKKNIRFYPRQSFSKVTGQGKTEISACTSCNDGETVKLSSFSLAE